jgi:hypothetical protein
MKTATISALVVSLLLAASTARAELLYGITDTQQLVTINSQTADVTSSKALTGLGGAQLISIDFRPATGELYGFSTGNQFFKINTATGAATPLGASLFMIDVIKAFDFDPVSDQIRLVTNLRKNLRINPNTAAVVSSDALLNYAVGDPNAATVPQVVHAAYTNSFAGASSTTLYNLEALNDVLTVQTPQNNGTLNTVGALGLPLGTLQSINGMDISGTTGIAYVVGKTLIGPGLVANTLYTVDLASGALASVGQMQSLGFASPMTFDDPHDPHDPHDPGFGTLVDVAALPGVVPEPSSFVLAGCGAVALAAVVRRQRTRRVRD